VSAARAGVLVVLTMVQLALPHPAVAQTTTSPGAPPRVLNIVRVKVKPKVAGAYSALEGQIVRAYDRAKAPIYWICLQGPRDASDVLYLNLHDSVDAADRMTAAYRDVIKLHPELTALQQRLTDLTASTASTLTARRDDVDRALAGVDFATMRGLRLTVFQVKPGREGDFLKAIRTTSVKEGSWLVYEATDSSTYALMTLRRAGTKRRDNTSVPRALRRFASVYTKTETRTYDVRPAMSHVSQAFVAANPQLWRLSAATH
jgi:hypothetical protein